MSSLLFGCVTQKKLSTADISFDVQRLTPATSATRAPKTVLVIPATNSQLIDICQTIRTRMSLSKTQSTNGASVEEKIAECISAQVNISQVDPLNALAAAELRKLLVVHPEVRLVDEQFASSADITIKVHISEFTWDVNKLGNEIQAPTMSASMILSNITPYLAASAPLLGPLGGAISAFDFVTGIPVSSHDGRTIGALAVENNCFDRSGKVLTSLGQTAQFTSAYDETGDESMGSYSKTVKRSTPIDAVRIAEKTIADQILTRCLL